MNVMIGIFLKKFPLNCLLQFSSNGAYSNAYEMEIKPVLHFPR